VTGWDVLLFVVGLVLGIGGSVWYYERRLQQEQYKMLVDGGQLQNVEVTCLSSTRIRITGTALPAGSSKLIKLYTYLYDTEPGPELIPPDGSQEYPADGPPENLNFAIDRDIPAGFSGQDWVGVWAAFGVYKEALVPFGPCDSSSGSGSGIGFAARFASTGTVATPCSERLLPATLTGTITSKTGNCTGLPDSLTFTHSSQSGAWEASFPECGGGQFNLQCVGPVGNSAFTLSGANCINTATRLSANEEPFEVIFDVTADARMGSGTFRITLTE
jgi:hypothetical protein